jgi:hypothetical protein
MVFTVSRGNRHESTTNMKHDPEKAYRNTSISDSPIRLRAGGNVDCEEVSDSDAFVS